MQNSDKIQLFEEKKKNSQYIKYHFNAFMAVMGMYI